MRSLERNEKVGASEWKIYISSLKKYPNTKTILIYQNSVEDKVEYLSVK